ncbi:MAG: hypothetical protein HBSAPP03_27630 [Phycisphaerae bacterium]|nr:MAG: hypothetical protein HBSAPP03_27630 [Phycisphaerae bacterium]
MQQIKMFTGSEDQVGTLERTINDWLRTSGARVVKVFGNMSPQSVMPTTEGKATLSHEGGSRRFAPSDVFLCILYETA